MQSVDIYNNKESTFNFAAYTKERRALIEVQLSEYLSASDPSENLWQSMRYSVLSGGKRLRALLCLASAEAIIGTAPALNKHLQAYLPCACALEMVHAMSLIHDDLPALDNDDYRRGKPTNHKVYGEAIALLAGDALLMLAIEILIRYTPEYINRSLLLDVINRFCQSIGAGGMVGGQALDLAFTGKLSEWQSANNQANDRENKTIEAIHRGKTGALIQFAVWSGARLAGANISQLDCLDRFAEKLGFAFQIADDLLDATGNLSTLGKTPGKDQAANKVTWVTAFGEKQARAKLLSLEEEGLTILNNPVLITKETVQLKELLKYAIHREK